MSTALTTADASAFTAWLQAGCHLKDQRSDAQWAIVDWIADGQRRFPEQIKLGVVV